MKRALGAISTPRSLILVLATALISAVATASLIALTASDDAQPGPPLSVAVVGDQYAAGSHNRVVWPTLLAQRTGWSVSNFALPGAGFVADGQGGHAFTYQVERAQAAHPDVILIVGGINDTGLANPAPIEIGAVDAIHKATLGGTRTLVIGPTWFETPIPTSVTQVSDTLRKAAQTSGAPFLDALDPPWLTRAQMLPDLSGPTDEGQSTIADKIAPMGSLRSWSMTRARWSDVAAVALAVAVIVGLVVVARTATATTPPPPPAASTGRSQAAADTRPSVLFIGDSYTAGSDLPEKSYACMAAVRMGWLCNLSASPGTGYISGGPANRFVLDQYSGESTSFDERIPHLAARYDPRVVVLDGGRNDLFPPRADVFKAMSATIADARRTWPAATIIFIRPRFLNDPGNDLGFDDTFMAGLKADPAATGVIFLDPIEWFADTDTSALMAADREHPNLKGEEELAAALVRSLNEHGVTTAP